MNWLQVEDYGCGGWSDASDTKRRAKHYCAEMEKGSILIFSNPPFELPPQDVNFLVSLRAAETRFHKNISYRPNEDALRGMSDRMNRRRVHDVMRRYSAAARGFVADFLKPYAAGLRMDYASFRPLEEKGRDLSVHRSNARLHVDAFPTRPTGGARILRVFTNINPVSSREWMVADCFERLAVEFAEGRRPVNFGGRWPSLHRLRRGLESLGLPVRDRWPYDRFMLEFHDWMKENTIFQMAAEGKEAREFPPLATWLVFTDGLPHAVLSGQFVLEQTFLVPMEALVEPEASPVRVIERIVGSRLNQAQGTGCRSYGGLPFRIS